MPEVRLGPETDLLRLRVGFTLQHPDGTTVGNPKFFERTTSWLAGSI
jgi:hypothetical protein